MTKSEIIMQNIMQQCDGKVELVCLEIIDRSLDNILTTIKAAQYMAMEMPKESRRVVVEQMFSVLETDGMALIIAGIQLQKLFPEEVNEYVTKALEETETDE